MGYIYNYNHFNRGRIWVGWDKIKVNMKEVFNSNQGIFCDVSLIRGNPNFFTAIVYGSNNPMERKLFWHDMPT